MVECQAPDLADGALGHHWITVLTTEASALPPTLLMGHFQLRLSYPVVASRGPPLLMPILREWNGDQLKVPEIIRSFLSP